jgi:glycosyltransferase involved in cell wall biosynthesis
VNGLLTPPRDTVSLAQALIRLLGDDGTLANVFNKYNLDLVCREFDSRKNSPLAKQLVYDIGVKHTQRG